MFAISTTVTTWLLSIAALAIGSIGTYAIGIAGDQRRLAAEDARRWLGDRRALYSRYLALVELLEREADSIACFLPHDRDAPPLSSVDDSLVRDMSHDWIERWDTELQPMLTEVELMATPDVADLAARASQGVLEAVPQVQYLGPDQSRVTPTSYEEHWPVQQAAKDLCEILRNEMRIELGIQPIQDRQRDADWPWLPDRPSFDDHRRRMGAFLWPERTPGATESEHPET